MTEPERERFAALLDAGTVDAFRELHPDEPGFTWWDYRQGHFHRKMGLRIDAFLLSPPLGGAARELRDRPRLPQGTKPSDHAPLLCELRLMDGDDREGASHTSGGRRAAAGAGHCTGEGRRSSTSAAI